MNLFRSLMIRFGWKRVTQQDVAQGIREKDVHLLTYWAKKKEQRVPKTQSNLV